MPSKVDQRSNKLWRVQIPHSLTSENIFFSQQIKWFQITQTSKNKKTSLYDCFTCTSPKYRTRLGEPSLHITIGKPNSSTYWWAFGTGTTQTANQLPGKFLHSQRSSQSLAVSILSHCARTRAPATLLRQPSSRLPSVDMFRALPVCRLIGSFTSKDPEQEISDSFLTIIAISYESSRRGRGGKKISQWTEKGPKKINFQRKIMTFVFARNGRLFGLPGVRFQSGTWELALLMRT